MRQTPLTKIVRVRNANFEGIDTRSSYNDVVKNLEAKGFQKAESSKDEFYESWEHPEYKNEEVNTIISIGVQDNVQEVNYTLTKAPSLN